MRGPSQRQRNILLPQRQPARPGHLLFLFAKHKTDARECRRVTEGGTERRGRDSMEQCWAASRGRTILISDAARAAAAVAGTGLAFHFQSFLLLPCQKEVLSTGGVHGGAALGSCHLTDKQVSSTASLCNSCSNSCSCRGRYWLFMSIPNKANNNKGGAKNVPSLITA